MTRFKKCKSCTKTRPRLAIPQGQRAEYICTPCSMGGKRSRRHGKARRHAKGFKKDAS